MDFSNVKKITIPEGIVKNITNSSGQVIWKAGWTYTINLGAYITKLAYWTGNDTTKKYITTNTTVEVDSGDTLYISTTSDGCQVEPDTLQYHYTMSYVNSDITRTDEDDGGSVEVYGIATPSLQVYTLIGNYTNGSVTFRKNSVVVTQAEYGSSLTYTCTPNTGYQGGASGSLTLNNSDFSLNMSTHQATVSLGSASRITWSLSVTQSNYVTSWRYKIDSGSWVNKTGNYNITGIDYASSVTIEAFKPSDDAQYTYGSISGAGTFTYGVGRTTTLSCTRSNVMYTITWKYQISTTSGVQWTTSTTSYKYNATPNPSDVSSGIPSYVYSSKDAQDRQALTGYDSLAKVTASRTITAQYKWQYIIVTRGTRCTPSPNYSQESWVDSGTVITFTADSNCAFDSSGTATSTTTVTSAGLKSKTASYIYVTIGGTHCSANYSTGWISYNAKVTWTADAAYAFDTSNTTTTYDWVTTPGGTYSPNASYIKRYTLTISVTGSYGGYSVSRTSSPYQQASTGELSSGSTIYYGDVLSGSSSSGVQYGAWDCTPDDLTLPTGSWNGGATTSPSISLNARNTATANLYRRHSSNYNWVHLSSNWGINASTSLTDTGLDFDTTYYYHVARNQNRNYWVWSPSSSNYTGTNGVTGSVTASFTFTKGGTQTESNWIGGGETPISTGSQATYTVTWKYMQSYDNWTTATETYAYGSTPSRSDPGTVTSGNMRFVSNSWSDLSAIYSNRTITRNYTQQANISFSLSHCSSNVASGWQNVGTTITYTASNSWAFDSSGTTQVSTSVVSGGTYSKSAIWYYATITGTNCTTSRSSGWYNGNVTVYWDANKYYYFNLADIEVSQTINWPGTYGRTAHIMNSNNFNYGSGLLNMDHQLRNTSNFDEEEWVTYYQSIIYVKNQTNWNLHIVVGFQPYGTSSASVNYLPGSNGIGNVGQFSYETTDGYRSSTYITIILQKTNYPYEEITRFDVPIGSSC